ncbi:hypothetical protein N7448_007198 [Penicillium atrosanguineum]|uniref:uncharacterized protein n=1 Tax=Penicillium atrosanguineum TaxID=1132637 RepID=UPI0023A6475D|nr:uncharacterized protein N7443_010962 [Penicillium atrosanguineum]KAJ5133040.1 hypothetical protein N7448_007198 [Penicillium atrosanguineum]KAJ5141067.1 hypothetical protein N7526_002062 [Penicillium atrosanguineum]KAJ5290709.1 hypothetical protein N7443_010962 [Penicillium atrosanguineum]
MASSGKLSRVHLGRRRSPWSNEPDECSKDILGHREAPGDEAPDLNHFPDACLGMLEAPGLILTRAWRSPPRDLIGMTRHLYHDVLAAVSGEYLDDQLVFSRVGATPSRLGRVCKLRGSGGSRRLSSI